MAMAQEQQDNNKPIRGFGQQLNSLYGRTQNIKSAAQITRTIWTLLSSSVTAQIALLFLALFIIVIFLSSIAGGGGGGGGDQSLTPVSIDEAKRYIVIVDNPAPYSGRDGETLTETQKNFIYTTFALPLGSEGYKKLLSNSDGSPRPFYIYFYKPLGESGAGANGGANYGGGDTMRFWGFFEYKDARAGAVDVGLEHMLVHESGHIIDRRAGRGALSMPLASLNKSDGTDCYDTTNSRDGLNYIKSYAYRGTDGGNGGPLAESFAEALANNVFCAPGKDCFYAGHILNSTNIPDYPNACSNTYSWIKQNVFGGDDFFTPKPFAQPGPPPPSANDCGGAYDFSKAIYKDPSFLYKSTPNFGDPGCTMAGASKRDFFYSELKRILNGATTKDGAGKVFDDWVLFKIIIEHESRPQYDPNSFLPIAHYGLFQMNPASSVDGSTGGYYWKTQIYDAAMYNYQRECKFNYWSTTGHFADPEYKLSWTGIRCATAGNNAKPVQ